MNFLYFRKCFICFVKIIVLFNFLDNFSSTLQEDRLFLDYLLNFSKKRQKNFETEEQFIKFFFFRNKHDPCGLFIKKFPEFRRKSYQELQAMKNKGKDINAVVNFVGRFYNEVTNELRKIKENNGKKDYYRYFNLINNYDNNQLDISTELNVQKKRFIEQNNQDNNDNQTLFPDISLSVMFIDNNNNKHNSIDGVKIKNVGYPLGQRGNNIFVITTESETEKYFSK
jgi:hypothetical protein